MSNTVKRSVLDNNPSHYVITFFIALESFFIMITLEVIWTCKKELSADNAA